MKLINVDVTYKDQQILEVPDDFTDDGTIQEVWAEQLDPRSAEMVDWTIREVRK